MGYKVIFQFGVKNHVAADLVFVHVDLSVVPEKYLEYARNFPAVVNGGIKDIRKSVISENLVTPDDDWSGPVIVKTDLNFAGLPEYLLDYPKKIYKNASVMRCIHALGGMKSRRPYKIFDNVGSVPKELLSDKDFVVERFIPEIEGDYYCLRMFIFFGDKFTCRRILSLDPIVKAEPSSIVEPLEPHPAVYNWKKKFNLDYGKIDYVLHNGKPELIDINKTTGLGGRYVSQEQRNKGHIERSSAVEKFFIR